MEASVNAGASEVDVLAIAVGRGRERPPPPLGHVDARPSQLPGLRLQRFLGLNCSVQVALVPIKKQFCFNYWPIVNIPDLPIGGVKPGLNAIQFPNYGLSVF